MNIFFIGLSFYSLYENYLLHGEIEWVNQDDLDDGDELYFYVIAGWVSVLGTFSICCQLLRDAFFKFKAQWVNEVLIAFSAFVNLIYGMLSLMFGSAIFLVALGNVGNQGSFDWKSMGLFALILIVFGGFTYLGFLVLRQLFLKMEANTIREVEEEM